MAVAGTRLDTSTGGGKARGEACAARWASGH